MTDFSGVLGTPIEGMGLVLGRVPLPPGEEPPGWIVTQLDPAVVGPEVAPVTQEDFPGVAIEEPAGIAADSIDLGGFFAAFAPSQDFGGSIPNEELPIFTAPIDLDSNLATSIPEEFAGSMPLDEVGPLFDPIALPPVWPPTTSEEFGSSMPLDEIGPLFAPILVEPQSPPAIPEEFGVSMVAEETLTLVIEGLPVVIAIPIPTAEDFAVSMPLDEIAGFVAPPDWPFQAPPTPPEDFAGSVPQEESAVFTPAIEMTIEAPPNTPEDFGVSMPLDIAGIAADPIEVRPEAPPAISEEFGVSQPIDEVSTPGGDPIGIEIQAPPPIPEDFGVSMPIDIAGIAADPIDVEIQWPPPTAEEFAGSTFVEEAPTPGGDPIEVTPQAPPTIAEEFAGALAIDEPPTFIGFVAGEVALLFGNPEEFSGALPIDEPPILAESIEARPDWITGFTGEEFPPANFVDEPPAPISLFDAPFSPLLPVSVEQITTAFLVDEAPPFLRPAIGQPQWVSPSPEEPVFPPAPPPPPPPTPPVPANRKAPASGGDTGWTVYDLGIRERRLRELFEPPKPEAPIVKWEPPIKNVDPPERLPVIFVEPAPVKEIIVVEKEVIVVAPAEAPVAAPTITPRFVFGSVLVAAGTVSILTGISILLGKPPPKPTKRRRRRRRRV